MSAWQNQRKQQKNFVKVADLPAKKFKKRNKRTASSQKILM
jgi:hypothetical protein